MRAFDNYIKCFRSLLNMIVINVIFNVKHAMNCTDLNICDLPENLMT